MIYVCIFFVAVSCLFNISFAVDRHVEKVSIRKIAVSIETTVVASLNELVTEDEAFWQRDLSMSMPPCECVLKVGVDAMTTNSNYVGDNGTLDGVNLWMNENDASITFDGYKCKVEIIAASTENNRTIAVDAARELIDQGVVVIVGPEYSRVAIPVAEMANYKKTPMIATSASNPLVTLGLPFAFRISFVDTEQGSVLADFVTAKLNKTAAMAAIIYQEDDMYSEGLARVFKAEWEKLNGAGSVAAYVSYNYTNVENLNFEEQASKIASVNDTATVLFAPIQTEEIPSVINAVRDAGWHGQVVGGDAWSVDPNLPQKCGEACVGAYFASDFIASGAVGYAKTFADKYFATYGATPNLFAALSYDAMNLMETGLKQYGTWTCQLAEDRDGLRNAMGKLTNFQGVGGNITSFDANNNPKDKCVTFAQIINATAQVAFLSLICPITI